MSLRWWTYLYTNFWLHPSYLIGVYFQSMCTVMIITSSVIVVCMKCFFEQICTSCIYHNKSTQSILIRYVRLASAEGIGMLLNATALLSSNIWMCRISQARQDNYCQPSFFAVKRDSKTEKAIVDICWQLLHNILNVVFRYKIHDGVYGWNL